MFRRTYMQINTHIYTRIHKHTHTHTHTHTHISIYLSISLSIYIYIMRRDFFQAVTVSILLYGCATWTLIKRIEKKLNRRYARMLRAILNKSWKQLYGHLPPISKSILVRRGRHAEHCWRSKD